MLVMLVAINGLPLSTAWCAQQATIFVYHRFGDTAHQSTNIDIQVFASQLEYLSKNDYNVLQVGEIVQRLHNGIALPPKCVALTVDDGYKTFLSGAMPLLREYNFPVTLFVSSGSVGYNSYLDWQQLRELQQEGVEIGNHSANHPYFVSMEVDDPLHWHSQASADIAESQRVFAEKLGFKPILFAYPYGEYSPELVDLLKQHDFAAAFAQQSGVVSEKDSIYSLPRFPMGGSFATLTGFKSKLMMQSMPVQVLMPVSPVIDKGNDPPQMVFKLDASDIDVASMLCYVQGQEPVTVERLDNGTYRVVASAPLSGRRNKYTLTAQSKNGKTWYWFSHLWIHP